MPPARSTKWRRNREVKTKAVEEVVFDDAARAEYLTGFHKRKLQRAEAARAAALKREREERIRERRELRQQRKAEIEQHVKDVNKALKRANGEATDSSDDEEEDGDGSEDGEGEGDAAAAEEWHGFGDGPENIAREEEYVDEDKYTTVTVETVDIDREGFVRPGEESSEEEGEEGEEGKARKRTAEAAGGSEDGAPGSKKRVWTKEKPKDKDRPKKRKKKFRYETKSERKVTRAKERSKNSRAARERRGK